MAVQMNGTTGTGGSNFTQSVIDGLKIPQFYEVLLKLTPNGGNTMTLCMNPDEVKYGSSGAFMTYSIISLGDVKIPRGRGLVTVSWTGIFPGRSRKNEPYIMSEFWEEPQKCVKRVQSWISNGTKVNVLITGTGLNVDCYVEKFEGKYTGGHGDFEYDISFVEAKEVTVTAVTSSSGSGTESMGKTTGQRSESQNSKTQTSKSTPTIRMYTVKEGDTVWKIAQSLLGDGSRYYEIYDLNKGTIKEGTSLKIGQVLNIPAK